MPIDRLADVTTPELIDELMERLPAAVLAACISVPDGGAVENKVWWTGNRPTCIGLSVMARVALIRELRKEQP